jgi:hypothetical protein
MRALLHGLAEFTALSLLMCAVAVFAALACGA